MERIIRKGTAARLLVFLITGCNNSLELFLCDINYLKGSCCQVYLWYFLKMVEFDLTVEIFPDNYFSEIVFVKFFRKYPLTMKERQKKPVEPLECDTSGVPK